MNREEIQVSFPLSDYIFAYLISFRENCVAAAAKSIDATEVESGEYEIDGSVTLPDLTFTLGSGSDTKSLTVSRETWKIKDVNLM